VDFVASYHILKTDLILMNQKLKKFFRECLPPVLVRALKSPNRSGIVYNGEYSTWEEAMAVSTGYDLPTILTKTKEATLVVMNGEAAYERDSVLFDHIEYSLPVIGGLLLAAAKNEGHLSVLDFGGSLGSSYFQNRKFLNELTEVQWGIVEQPHYVACGRESIQDKQLRFYNTIEDCVAKSKPNVILLGSVLQYLNNPFQILDQLTRVRTDFLIIDRTPFSKLESDRIIIQQVPSSIYKANYPLWIFSRKDFDENFGEQWKLIEEFECNEGNVETKSGIKFSYKSMIFSL
jgi:putative methyltransferase (TIGR04325 family)